MAEIKGKLTVCEKCGEWHFSKLLGRKDFDGGYTHTDEFEELPEGWAYYTGIGTLCPTCGNALKRLVRDFLPDKTLAPCWDVVEVNK